MGSRAVVLAAVAVLAGCLGHPAAPLPAALASPAGMILSHCAALVAATNAYPAALAAGPVPQGWDPDPTEPASAVFMHGYECQRVHLGPLERGPVRLVWDAHETATIPPQCQAPKVPDAVLNALLTDDAGVAQQLRAEGLPAQEGSIAATSRPAAGGMTEHAWTWSVRGQPASRVTVDQQDGGAAEPWSMRLFWARPGGGVGRMDLNGTREGPLAALFGQGPMAAPMVLAHAPPQFFAGPTTAYAALDATATFQLFADGKCTVPAPEGTP